MSIIVHTHTHSLTHMHTHTYIYIYIYTHMYVCVEVCVWKSIGMCGKSLYSPMNPEGESSKLSLYYNMAIVVLYRHIIVVVLVHPESYSLKRFTCLCILINSSVDNKAIYNLIWLLESTGIVATFVYTTIIIINILDKVLQISLNYKLAILQSQILHNMLSAKY